MGNFCKKEEEGAARRGKEKEVAARRGRRKRGRRHQQMGLALSLSLFYYFRALQRQSGFFMLLAARLLCTIQVDERSSAGITVVWAWRAW